MKGGSEYKWILEGFTPDSIPMARLSEYMLQLSKLLGSEAAVHFVRIEPGSLAVCSKVDPGDAPERVSERVESIREGKASGDALRAYETLNEMLSDDRTRATLMKGGDNVLQFPGSVKPEEPIIEVQDAGSLDGYLYSLAQIGDRNHARLRVGDGMVQCAVSDDMARRLKEYLFETVRVYGHGQWQRRVDGRWKATAFNITGVERLKNVSLRELVSQLRGLDIAWPEDPLGEWAALNDENGSLH